MLLLKQPLDVVGEIGQLDFYATDLDLIRL